jgi:hypothetical protein
MHNIQTLLLGMAKNTNLGELSLRQIAKMIGVEDKPQIVKYHLLQLEKAGLLQLNLEAGIIKPITRGSNASTSVKSPFYSLPIVGMANCGPATVFAEERIEGVKRAFDGSRGVRPASDWLNDPRFEIKLEEPCFFKL